MCMMSLAVHMRSLPQPPWLKTAPSKERHLDRRPRAAIYKSRVRSSVVELIYSNSKFYMIVNFGMVAEQWLH